jgi:hypothetical protein
MSRSLRAPAIRSRGLRGPGAPWLAAIDLFADGTFTRSTEASYLTGAPTDGSTAFLAWAAANERRLEDRGDGNGRMLLMEGSRTNYVVNSRATGAAGWSASGTVTANAGNGPDATLVADRNTCASGGFGSYQATAPGGAGTRIIQSLYARRMPSAGPDEAHFGVQDGASPGTGVYTSAAITETWARVQSASYAVTSAPVYHVPWEGRAVGGLTGRALDYLADLHQLEVGAFASSPISSGGTATTRGADRLTLTTSQYPVSMLDNGFAIEFAPDFLPSEMHTNGAGFMLLGVAGNASSLQGAFLSYSVVGDPARIFVNNTTSFSDPFSWATRRQKMRVEVRPSAGKITISGATNGNGTTTVAPWTITPGTIDIGQRATGSATNAWFGGLGRYIEVL